MLVISRDNSESILIGDEITITILEIAPGHVKIGIDAPRDFLVLREELRTGGASERNGQNDHSNRKKSYTGLYRRNRMHQKMDREK